MFNNPLDHEMRSQFHNEIYDRINQEYLNNYNLSTKTFVNYCTDPQQRKPKGKRCYLLEDSTGIDLFKFKN